MIRFRRWWTIEKHRELPGRRLNYWTAMSGRISLGGGFRNHQIASRIRCNWSSSHLASARKFYCGAPCWLWSKIDNSVLPAGRRVPEPDGIVIGARGPGHPIGRPGHRIDGACVPF